MGAAVVSLGAGCPASDDDVAWDPQAESSTGATDQSSGAEASVGDGTETEASTTGLESTGGEPGCPAPPVPPQLDASNEQFACPEGMTLDAAYPLCVGEGLARGPFTPAMTQACEACGATACADEDWPEDLARGLRGTERCPPGAALEGELCVDPTYAWGPFSPGLVAACVAAGGGMACSSMRWERTFAESLDPVDPLAGPWTWILPLDHALRDDGLGGGHFGALRSGNPGGHSGIDVLAPVGTSLIAPCDGPVWAGQASGYGNYVQLVCPVPEVVAQGQSLYASIFFAHLDTLAVANGASVSAGEVVGTVGKTGNADDPQINAHVHFEIAIHDSEAAALAELHASADHSATSAGDAFAVLIADVCWDPNGFSPLTGPTMKGRRPDPFMMLACLTDDKPAMTAPPAGLQGYLVPWSDHYEATGFDVDAG